MVWSPGLIQFLCTEFQQGIYADIFGSVRHNGHEYMQTLKNIKELPQETEGGPSVLVAS